MEYFLNINKISPDKRDVRLSRRAISLIVFLVIFIAGLNLMLYLFVRKYETSIIVQQEKHEVSLRGQAARSQLAEIVSDLNYLADQTETWFVTGKNNLKLLQGYYSSFLNRKDIYETARFIGLTGMESVREDHALRWMSAPSGSGLPEADEARLFESAMNLAPGGVHVSPFTLKKENGKIAVPYQPVILAARKVYNGDGEPAGVVVLSYLGLDLLQKLSKSDPADQEEIILLDREGHWLLGGLEEDRWKFMLDDRREKTFAARYPEVWQRIEAAPSGSFIVSEGLYTFTTIHLEAAARVDSTTAEQGPVWTLISFVKKANFHAGAGRIPPFLLITNLLVVFIAGAAAIKNVRLQRTLVAEHTELRSFRQAVEQSPAIVVMADLDGNITYANPKFSMTTGYKVEEVIGKNPRILKSGKQPPEVYHQLWQAISSGREWRGELQNKKKSGEIYWEYASMSPIVDDDGNIIHYLAIKEDITERKRVEAELFKAMEAAQAANKAKSLFLANMSHEIRTPMNGITGMASLLLETGLSSRQREYASIINASAHSLLQLLNEILDLSKIESGRFELEEEPFALRTVVFQAVKSIYPEAFRKGLEFSVLVDRSLPAKVIGDQARLRQVLMNLMGNAIKFTSQGEVAVRVKPGSKLEDENAILFEIMDTGIGISIDKQQEIFSPFTQADSSTTRLYGGTGLGLSISAQIVEMMGSRIWLDSEPGRGSRFYFSIKLPEARSGNGSKEERGGYELLKDYRAVAVNSHDMARSIWSDCLTGWGAGTESFATLNQAVEVIAGLAADSGELPVLVLVDGDLPGGLSGPDYERLVILRNSGKIRMLTALSPLAYPEAEEEETAGAALYKPLMTDDVPGSLRAVLGFRGGCRPDEKDVCGDVPLDEQPSLDILLVEDNLVNRMVASNLLQNRGHRVSMATNGLEGVGEFESGRFDLILMDVKMPGMDGIEATRRIREIEKRTGGHTPILALTARAMKEDLDECLASGMDGYVTKPISPAELRQKMDIFCSREKQLSGEAAEPNVTALVKKDELLARVGGDWELLDDLAALFEEELPVRLSEIRTAISEKNASELDIAATALRGSASHFAGESAMEAIDDLKAACRQGDFEAVMKKYNRAAEELKRMTGALRELISRRNVRMAGQ